MQRANLTLFLLLVLGGAHGNALGGVADSSEVPFTLEKGYVVVQAKIMRHVPVEMVLATGAEHSTFSAGVIEKYKLSLNYTSDDPRTCNLADCTFTYSNVPDIQVGDLKPMSLYMRLGTLNSVRQRLGRDVFGILGADFFKGR